MKRIKLSELFNIEHDLIIDSISIDSREKNENGIFFCMPGTTFDSHDFIDQAIENGSRVIVHTRDIQKREGIVYKKVEDIYLTLRDVLNKIFDYPTKDLSVYAVTGTNGKTTTAMIIENLLSNFEKAAYIGTLGVKIKGKLEEVNHMTTPDIVTLCRILDDINRQGCSSLAIEVSSHALDQHRTDILDVDVAIFTNLTHEHLDYHKDMLGYMKAKRKLFETLTEDKFAIVNLDDDYARDMISTTKAKVITYGKSKECDFRISNVIESIDGTTFDLMTRDKTFRVSTNLVSKINTYNLTSAIIALSLKGYEIEEILKYTNNLENNLGRFQAVENSRYKVIVDFAHTPDGFVKIFEFAKNIFKDNHIVVVFGCPGKRDTTKRAILGKIADDYCDKIVICEEDYRDEDPDKIAREILSGIINKEKATVVIDRYQAIYHALSTSKEGDLILILGKGLDNFLSRNGKDEFWMNDVSACEEILTKLGYR